MCKTQGMAGKEKGRRHGRPGAKGMELFKEGKYEEAINEFTKFVKTMPDDEIKKVAHYNRGMSYYNLRQYDKALEDGESCLKIDPFWVKGYKCKGLALEGMGRPRDAIDCCLNGQEMCSSLDKNTDALLNPIIERSNLKIATDKIENKKERKGKSTGTKGVELFKEGKYKEAISEFTRYLKTEQDDENKKVAHYNRGMANYNLGQYDSALEDGESCLKIDPSWVKGYKCKGLALEGLGKLGNAIDTFLNGQKMCSSLDENTDAILNPLIEKSNLKIATDKIENKKERKGKSTGTKGVELFKEGKYKEAISEFTRYLKTEQDNKNKKIAHYNRGMAHYNLGQYDSALEDGEECLKIDPFWAKGYKCKGLTLEKMGRPRDAAGTFLDGQKMCIYHDENTEAVLVELIKRLNRATGFLGEDLELWDRKRKEKYCVVCNQFEKDMDVDSKKFISCDRCKMVNYCCQRHRENDEVTHNEVCEELLAMRKNSEKNCVVEVLQKEDALALLALKLEGPEGQRMVDMMKRFDFPPDIMEYLRGVGDGNYIPLYQLAWFKPIAKTQQRELNTWNDLFTMLDKVILGAAVDKQDNDIIRTLTGVLTDPMTVFYAMKQATLLDNSDEDKVISLHVVGAEPTEEVAGIKAFINVLSSITGRNLHIVLIGPLLISPPGQVQKANKQITSFRGTYQEYILTSDYKKPDCIVALFPGLYDGTYNWLPAVAQAVAKMIPFLVTCNTKEDYQKTKDWLMKEKYVKPEIVQDYLNPFGSRQAVQDCPGSNSINKRNMFCLLLMGGDFDVLRPLLQVKNENVEIVQALFSSLGNDAISDIMKLKRSGKM